MAGRFSFFASGFCASAAFGAVWFGHPELGLAPAAMSIVNAFCGVLLWRTGR